MPRNMPIYCLILFSCCLIPTSFGALVVDTAANLSVSQWECLNQQGAKLMLGHIYKSSGTFDEVGFQNLYNAYTAGNYEGIDSFISPCVSGNCANGLNSGKDQANAILERITQIEQFHPFPWISVSRADGWSADPETNAAFLKDMIETIWININAVGIFTSYNDWMAIIGPKFPLISQYSHYLTYIAWNGKEDLTSGFSPFGGWASAYAHQYAGSITSNNCTNGASINYGYYNDSSFALRKIVMKKKITNK